MRDYRTYSATALRVVRLGLWDAIKRYRLNTDRGYHFDHVRAYYQVLELHASKCLLAAQPLDI